MAAAKGARTYGLLYTVGAVEDEILGRKRDPLMPFGDEGQGHEESRKSRKDLIKADYLTNGNGVRATQKCDTWICISRF